MNIRERTEEYEKKMLSPYATLAANTKGRMREAEKSPGGKHHGSNCREASPSRTLH